MRVRLKLFTIATSLVLAVAMAIGMAGIAYAAMTDAPATSKTLYDNGDGSYTLALSVTGASETSTSSKVSKANVVLVIDTSSSMNWSSGEESAVTYTAVSGTPTDHNGTYYGVNEDGEYFKVYWNKKNKEWRTGKGKNASRYEGTFYTREGGGALTRLEALQDALTKDGGIIDGLLAQNVAGDANKSDIIEVAIVDFNASATETKGFTNSATDLKDTVNDLDTNTGTNWEAGLKQAKATADAIKASQSDEPVYVIFLTDGVPTSADSGYAYSTSGYWDYAKDEARAIVEAGYTFYGLFAWGSTNDTHYLSSLVQYAYTGSGNTNTPLDSDYAQYYTDASDTDKLIEALQQIVNTITNNVGYTSVEMKDTVTTMTASNLTASVDGEVTGIKYYRSGGKDNKYGTANPSAGNYSTEWNDAPTATVSGGTVDWNLDDITLEDGVTYTMTFVVWPSQASLDLVADLNNGLEQYDNLTAAQKAQIIQNEDGTYSLKTNTDYPTVTYSTVTTTTDSSGHTSTSTSDPKTSNITNPGPVGLSGYQLNAVKNWEDNNNTSLRSDVSLDLYKDGTKYFGPVTLTAESSWTESKWVNVAPGIMVASTSPAYDATKPQVTWNGTTYAILESGHEYVFEETSTNNHYTLTAYTHHPMLIDGTLYDVTFTKDSSGKITGIKSATKMIDSITATNVLKGTINITKAVVDKDGNPVTNCKDPFSVTVTVTDASGNALPDKTADETTYNIAYVVNYGENNPSYTSGGKNQSNCTYKAGTSFTETLYAGDVITVMDLESGAVYCVEETAPAGYELKSIVYSNTTDGSTYSDYASTDIVKVNGKDCYPVADKTISKAVVTNASVAGNLKVSKTVTVKSGDEAKAKTKKFTFTLDLYTDKTKATKLTDGTYSYVISKADGTESTGTVKPGGTFELMDGESITITGLNAGTYYEVTETAAAGYTTTPTGGVASGSIVADQTAEAAFTNTYNVTSVKVDPPVKKDITGTESLYNKGDFTFTIANTAAPDGVTAPIPAKTEITNVAANELADKKGYYEFGEIEFKAPGTYTYTVTESGSALGVTNDSQSTKTITFTVTDNGEGALSVTPATDSAVFSFTNAYKTGELDITKTVVNTANANDATKFTFTVTIKDAKGVTVKGTFPYMIGETSGDIASGGTLELEGDETAKITGLPDGAKYTVTETAATGYTNTTKSGDSGAIDSNKVATAAFTNTRDTGSLKVTKTVDGAFTSVSDLPDGFTITVKDASGKDYATITKSQLVSGNGTVTLSDVPTGSYTATESNANIVTYDLTTTGTDIAATVEKDGTATITITNTYARQTGSLTVAKTMAGDVTDLSKLPDNFTITVKDANGTTYKTVSKSELVSGGGSVTLTGVPTGTYSASEANYTISGYTVSPANSGKATVAKGETATITITNTYASAPASTVITAKKVLEGAKLAAGQFTFRLSGDTLATPITASNAADGTVAFNPLSFDAAGTYTFTITEVKGDKDYITYSESSHTVTVVVEANADGSLKVASKTGDGTAAVFTNTYTAAGRVEPTVKKTLKGRTLEADEFSFTLKGMNPSLSMSAKNAANGSVTFDTIEYTLEGVKKDVTAGYAKDNGDGTYTYTYTITEDTGSLGGITYATNAVVLTVTLTDDGEGNLTATTDYSSNGEFVNTYKASGSITFAGTKSIEGRTMTDDDVFSFAIYEGETLVAECKNDSTGKINYPTITYNLNADTNDTGTHTYTVKETSTDGNGITVDTKTHTVTVEVTDNATGELSVTSENSTGLDFVNTYDAKPITIVPSATKQLNGKDLTKGQFTFQLLDSEGSLIEETTNTTDGQVAFSAITYKLEDVGTHTYKIVEVNDEQEYVTYDEQEVTLTVVVTDNGDGTLSADVTYNPDNKFVNTYDEPEVGLEVIKKATSKPANGKYYKAGETVSYEIVVTNIGEVDLTDVKVDDELTGDHWTIATLAAGASETYTAKHKVTDADVKAGTVLNVVTATAENPLDSDDPLEDDDTVTVKTGKDSTPKKKRVIPQTGDPASGMAVLYASLAGSASLLTGVSLRRRKRK